MLFTEHKAIYQAIKLLDYSTTLRVVFIFLIIKADNGLFNIVTLNKVLCFQKANLIAG